VLPVLPGANDDIMNSVSNGREYGCSRGSDSITTYCYRELEMGICPFRYGNDHTIEFESRLHDNDNDIDMIMMDGCQFHRAAFNA
jgi:hypothetical protein